MYLYVFSPNARKYGPEKLRVRTLFMQLHFAQKLKKEELQLRSFQENLRTAIAK